MSPEHARMRRSMVVMLVAGIHSDLKVRRILRDCLAPLADPFAFARWQSAVEPTPFIVDGLHILIPDGAGRVRGDSTSDDVRPDAR